MVFSDQDTKITEVHLARHQHKYTYDDIKCIEGERSGVDYAINCPKHGWQLVTKKSFRAGKDCRLCGREKQRIKSSETLKKKHVKENGGVAFVTKTCKNCKKTFTVRNTSRERKRVLCSSECNREYSANRFTMMNQTSEHKTRVSTFIKKMWEHGDRTPAESRTKWVNYKNIKVQGSFELQVCKSLDFLKNNKKIYNWEYTNDRIKYKRLGESSAVYLMDFKVYITKNIFFYLETKGLPVINDLYKWRQVIQEYPFKVLFFKGEFEKIKKNPDYILEKETLKNSDLKGIIQKNAFLRKNIEDRF